MQPSENDPKHYFPSFPDTSLKTILIPGAVPHLLGIIVARPGLGGINCACHSPPCALRCIPSIDGRASPACTRSATRLQQLQWCTTPHPRPHATLAPASLVPRADMLTYPTSQNGMQQTWFRGTCQATARALQPTWASCLLTCSICRPSPLHRPTARPCAPRPDPLQIHMWTTNQSPWQTDSACLCEKIGNLTPFGLSRLT
jgi:hypothetical protein